MFYITRKAAKNDGAVDAAQVTCSCLGEKGPFFRTFCMLSFAPLLLAGSLAGFGAGNTEGGGSCSLGAVQRAVTVISDSSRKSEGMSGTDLGSPGL